MTTPFRLLLSSLLLAAITPPVAFAAPAPLADFQARAAKAGHILSLPDYPLTADAIKARTEAAIREADAAFAKLVAQDPARATFASTFAAADTITSAVATCANQISTIAESNPDAALRDAARAAEVSLENWGIALEYREDIYLALKAVADTKPALDAQQQRLMDHTLRDYRRAGLALPPVERTRVEQLRKRLGELEQQFSLNINQARAPLDFSAEELAGVPQTFLDSPGVRQADGRYRVQPQITFHTVAIAENAANPETRRAVHLARSRLAREKNIPVLAKLVALRAEIAQRLGYANWADFRTETRMSGNAATALKFEEELTAGLQPKFDAEKETLRELKAAHTGLAEAKLDPWDVSFYTNRLLKERYAVDTESLKVFFPYEATLQGMLAIYERIFGLKFTEVGAPYVWAPGVQLYVVADATTGEPQGAFYLDMFPREGKYNHFAHFRQKTARYLSDGRYELPVSVLLCNFPPPSADRPSLLSHGNVTTLFHEFGHVLHNLLGRARYQSQTYSGVPRDFVEAPSQMLENWVWDKAVLDTFAADYRDPANKIPAETIAAMVRAREATEGFATRRQLSLGLIDLGLHTLSVDDAWTADVVALSDAVAARVYLEPAADTAFVANFGHLAGYDAGYYGYLWSKVMAIDMASIFRAAPGGFFDETVGHRLRDEIYAAGNTREVAESVEKFLGRARSQAAYLDYVGIKR
ncbi:Oligopeptidase A [Lacunisphaera limnophila]|uniref:Oligopeptidase A n=1 Tax=Lacunisphaera limnophila TaxID=1838286 RepID=A0A1D8ARN7_9BACT|nr:M3 family metallopeptidase [Lacunisphaera limnophila]AOS43542.1 Oligopeptidase A [Lacunisphaera limnophila]